MVISFWGIVLSMLLSLDRYFESVAFLLFGLYSAKLLKIRWWDWYLVSLTILSMTAYYTV